MKYAAVLMSTVALASARLDALHPLEPAADAPESWLQVCCQDNDKNDDGGISFREFTPFVLEILDLDRKGLSEIFLAGDLDRNSDLDGNECPIIRSKLREKMREKVDKALREYDSDGDRQLSKEEIQKLAQQDFKMEQKEAEEAANGFSAPVSGERLTELLLELRSRQVQKFGGKLTVRN